MKNEERYIRNKMGDANPFRVPDGYFDSFPSRIMEQLSEREAVEIPMRRSFVSRFRGIMYAAACILLAVFGTVVYINESGSSKRKAARSKGFCTLTHPWDTLRTARENTERLDVSCRKTEN